MAKPTSEMLALALDLGGTKVEAALVAADGTLVNESRFRRATGASSGSAELEFSVRSVIGDALAAMPPAAELVGAGIGAAGPIRQDQGLVSPLNLPAWRDFALQALVSEVVGAVPVSLKLDGLCITLAEHWLGAARGTSSVMGMVVSTGIGGGLVLNDKAVTGPSGNAGHIGHVEVAGFDDWCSCGGRGCLEAIASGPRTVAWARDQGWEGSSGEDLGKSYQAGEEIARAAIERCGLAIGRAIASATALLDLELVTIGGGFSQVTPDLFEIIRSSVAKAKEFDFVKKVQVRPSALSDEGPLLGAASLVHQAAVFD